jgi:ribonucleotide reductase alpha subunit
MHLYSWKRGLKTLSYYVRSRASTEAIKFTVDNVKTANVVVEEEEEECLACQA